MKWEVYYDRFWDWAESTQISRISTLTDFTSSAEVAEIATEFHDEKISARLIRRALRNGIRFSPAEIVECAYYLPKETLSELLRTRQGRLTAEQYEELQGLCDEEVLQSAAREDGVPLETDAPSGLNALLEFDTLLNDVLDETEGLLDRLRLIKAQTAEVQPKKKPQGLLSRLLNFLYTPPGPQSGASGTMFAPTRAHPGRCSRNCSSCPAHYGYRYGRWYYGHHHSHGCEFGGNDCSGRNR